MDVKSDKPLEAHHPGRRAPLVFSIVASTLLTLFVSLVALVAAATGCGFAGGRCDSTVSSRVGSATFIASVAAAAAWGSTVWVAYQRRRSVSVATLYIVGVGAPVLIGLAAATLAILVTT